jgi:septal ring factor EnvC (AmiA/AmiB activator)
MEAVLVKKRLEQDINELELTLDSVNRARAEAEKNWKQCQQELSDLEELLDEEHRTKYIYQSF